jgi:hypothetical protein
LAARLNEHGVMDVAQLVALVSPTSFRESTAPDGQQGATSSAPASPILRIYEQLPEEQQFLLLETALKLRRRAVRDEDGE